jgi:hypothetical protein
VRATLCTWPSAPAACLLANASIRPRAGQSARAGAFGAIGRTVGQKCAPAATFAALHPALRSLEQLLSPDWRGSPRTVAFRTEPSATWEPAAGHSAATLADRANIIAGFNAPWHAQKYRVD